MMFWHDIKEIKQWMNNLDCRPYDQALVDRMKELIDDQFSSEDEYNILNLIHNKLVILINDKKRLESVELALKTLDKFEDYMKNIDKLNEMVNELKGCVSIMRASVQKKKQKPKKSRKVKES